METNNQPPQMNLSTPPTPPPLPKPYKRPWWVYVLLVVLLGAALIGAHYMSKPYEAGGDEWAKNMVTGLTLDSMALAANLEPNGGIYTQSQIMENIRFIKERKYPTRAEGFQMEDTAALYTCPKTASLAKHNKQRVIDLLNYTLPKWRRKYVEAFNHKNTLKDIVAIDKSDKEIVVISPLFKDDDKLAEIIGGIRGDLQTLGFKDLYIGSGLYGELLREPL